MTAAPRWAYVKDRAVYLLEQDGWRRCGSELENDRFLLRLLHPLPSRPTMFVILLEKVFTVAREVPQPPLEATVGQQPAERAHDDRADDAAAVPHRF